MPFFSSTTSLHILIKMRLLVRGAVTALLLLPITQANPAHSFAEKAEPFFQDYCYKCHGKGEKIKGDIDLTEFASDASIIKDRDIWLDILEQVETEEMPTKEPLPTDEERAAFVAWLEHKLDEIDWSKVKYAGHTTMPRLTKKEYNNTLRDLLGVDVQPGHILFEDGEGASGFTSDRSNLFVSPASMEKYFEAAETALNAMVTGLSPINKKFQAEDMLSTSMSSKPVTIKGAKAIRLTIGQTTLYDSIEVPMDGTYKLELRGLSANADDGSAKIRLNNKDLGSVTFPGKDYTTQSINIFIPKGAHQLTINKGVNSRRIIKGSKKTFLKEVDIDWIQLSGPNKLLQKTKRKAAYSTRPTAGLSEEESAKKVLSHFLLRAFRRPVEEEVIKKYHGLFNKLRKESLSYSYSLQQTMLAILVSPRFLYRHELAPFSLGYLDEYPLDHFQIASRLSYFLWLSMPDDELFRLAKEKKLRDPLVLKAQIKRMIADPKSRDFTSTFLGQWLGFESLGNNVIPDSKTFPRFDRQLLDAMKKETILTFEHLIRKDQSILVLLDSKATYLNERLADHYKINNIKGDHMRPVLLDSSASAQGRGGLLGMGSILTATSSPTRTSPVLRGKWVMETLLGERIPEAPADVPEIDENAGVTKKTTLRKELEQHRANPSCARCHDKIDPIGFGLENFDAIGRFRTKEKSGQPIDSSGEMQNFKFEGVAQLKTWLIAHRKEAFVRTVSENMLAFALGREIETFDEAPIQKITTALKENDYKASILIEEIILSHPFLHQTHNNEITPPTNSPTSTKHQKSHE